MLQRRIAIQLRPARDIFAVPYPYASPWTMHKRKGKVMNLALGRLVIYTKKVDEMAEFYQRYFGFDVVRNEGDRIVELKPKASGASILLHAAAKGQKEGQVLVKLVFDVEDVAAFCDEAKARGLEFGSIHTADGYVFANAKDPSKNSIQVSSRAFVT